MSNIFYDTTVSEAEAEASSQNYSPSVQEDVEETPEQVDNSPITESEREALDKAGEDTFQPIVGTDNQAVSDRPATPAFVPPGDWVSPVKRHRQKQAALLPHRASINDLDARISAVMKTDGAPKRVTDLASKARVAVGAAREAREAAARPDAPKYTVSVEAKDATVKAIAEATTLVGALEREAKGASEEWFANLTDNLEKKREAALKAVKAAEKAYASFRADVNGAQALAIESGRWDKSWHQSTLREADLNAPISAMRDAVGFLDSEDDFASGRFLTEEYDGIPPHTMAKLKRGAEIAQPGSFAQQIYARARSQMKHDRDLQDALRTKHLIPFLNSNPLSTDLMGRKPEDQD